VLASLPERLGAYIIEGRLAHGGSAEVFAGRDPAGTAVVIKAVRLALDSRQDARQLLDEARVATLVDHPHVGRVFSVDVAPGWYFLVMERLEGVTLAQLTATRSGQPLPITAALRFVADAARGLHAAHETTTARGEPLGLVHRDVSPYNLFACASGIVKVIDFGVAKSSVQIVRTRTGIVKGNASYMSPEQCAGSPLDRRSDVFSLGVVLHELLTGRRLFEDADSREVMRRILSEPAPPPQRDGAPLDEDVVFATLGALRQDPQARYPTAAMFADALEQCLARRTEPRRDELGDLVRQHLSSSASGFAGDESTLLTWAGEITQQLTARHSQREPSRRTPWLVAAGVAVALSAGLPVFWFTRPRQQSAALVEAPRASSAVELPVAPPRAAPVTPEQRPLEQAPIPDGRDNPTARRASPRPVRAPEPLAPGRLWLEAIPWAKVYRGEVLLGTTPLVNVALPAGKHILRLVNPNEAIEQRVIVEIPAGGEVRRVVSLR
jgi:eukaryotic-like serine/threonine-protein kinase